MDAGKRPQDPVSPAKLDSIGAPRPARRRKLPDLVARELRNAILTGQLASGARLRQEVVAAQFGTSRIPVREALRQLASEGLVVLQPEVGARVAKLDINELVEVYMLRERLEPLAIGESAPNLSVEHLHDLEEVLSRLERAVDWGGPEKWLEIDREFHSLSYQGARWGRLLRLIDGFWDTTHQYRRAYALLPQRFGLADSEHRLILEALQRRDDVDAAKLLEVHIRRTRLTLLSKPELFEAEDASASTLRSQGPVAPGTARRTGRARRQSMTEGRDSIPGG